MDTTGSVSNKAAEHQIVVNVVGRTRGVGNSHGTTAGQLVMTK